MTAIIPAAGHGTRFLPVTRVVPKEMLPIGAKPALELIVEEAKSAGADEIVMVISKGKELIREYFKDDPAIRFVYQLEQKGLGHAVLQAAPLLQSSPSPSPSTSPSPSPSPSPSASPLLILLGDALVAGCNAAKEMAALSAANGGAGVIGLERVPPEKVSRYGIVKPRGKRQGGTVGGGETVEIADIVEKPSVEEAPSDLAVAGRYLLPVEIMDYLRTQTPGKGGEIQLTDAIRRMILSPADPNLRTTKSPSALLGYVYPGKRQDIGNPRGYLDALLAMTPAL